MPIIESYLSFKSPSDVLFASDIPKLCEGLSKLVNGGITRDDFLQDGTGDPRPVITTSHIFKPEFYGSPSPHVSGVSSDTYYRRRSGNKLNRYYRHENIGSQTMSGFSDAKAQEDFSAWQPIEGLSATVFINEINTGFNSAHVMANWYAQEKGGKVGTTRGKILSKGRTDGDSNRLESLSGYNRANSAGTYVAVFALFVDTMDGDGPQIQYSTRRYLFGTGGGRYRCRKMNHSINHLVRGLTEGENKISVRCFYRLVRPEDVRLRHVYVDSRNLVIDVLYR